MPKYGHINKVKPVLTLCWGACHPHATLIYFVAHNSVNFYPILIIKKTYILVFKRVVAISRAPQSMVLSMLRSLGKIGQPVGTQSPDPLKSSVTGLSLLVNCYLEIKYHKKVRVNPPPHPPLSSLNYIKEGKIVQSDDLNPPPLGDRGMNV